MLNTTGLSTAEIKNLYPSVYAEDKHENRSARYLYIPTSKIIDGLRGEGFAPTFVMQSKSRTPGMEGFTKHLLRFRRVQDLGNSRPDVFEFVLINSHNGSSAYELLSGFFRTVCTNGLISGDYNSTLKVAHKGNILDQIIEATYKVVSQADETMDAVEEMKRIQLTRPEQLLLAKYAMKARFPEEKVVEGSLVYEPKDFLRVRRNADSGSDLYTTLNVVQENVIRGGITRYDERLNKHKTRAINGIDQSVKANQLLWSFAQELRALHNQ